MLATDINPDPLYSAKHHHHGMNVQGITDAQGELLYLGQARPGSTHDLKAARADGMIKAVTDADVETSPTPATKAPAERSALRSRGRRARAINGHEKRANFAHTKLRARRAEHRRPQTRESAPPRPHQPEPPRFTFRSTKEYFMFSEEEYREDFAYLAEYVHDDWLGFSVITGVAGRLLGPGYDLREENELTLRIVRDLLDLGAQAGDLSGDPDEPFKPWLLAKEASVLQIDSELKKLGKSPESGDICWIMLD